MTNFLVIRLWETVLKPETTENQKKLVLQMRKIINFLISRLWEIGEAKDRRHLDF